MERALIINLGPAADIPAGQGKCFVVKREEVAVFRPRDGKTFAVANTCPHLGGPLSEGIMGNGKVICPLHGHKFDLKTGKGSEGGECVRAFETWVEHGNVYMQYVSPVSREKEKEISTYL